MKNVKTMMVIFAVLVFSFFVSLPVFAQTTPADNPTLGDACGLDIAILLDMTGSISSGGEVSNVKTAAKSFIDAFLPSTPTMIGLVEFSDGSASLVQDLTNNEVDLKSDVDSLSASGATNWQAAFLLGTQMLEGGSDRDDTLHGDLMIIITDGDPNEPGSDANALEVAIVAANNAKTSSSDQPIRIVAIGVGDANESNLVAVSGPNVNGTITKDTDVITGEFTDLTTILADLASALCDEPTTECTACHRNEVNVFNNENYAFVYNDVKANANTGNNYADGSYAGSGGEGGDMINSNDDVSGSTTGNGGVGGNAGVGGTVYTGDASSAVSLDNRVNSNRIEVEQCPCVSGSCCEEDGCCNESFEANLIHNHNVATVFNRARANTNTGDNEADGSYAGMGGEAGNIVNGGGDDVEDSTTGNGGMGGDSSDGGLVQSGNASSRTAVMNLVNVNITRLHR